MKNRYGRLLPLCAAALMMTGCAQYRAGPYSADYQALDRLKAAKLEPAAVATVQPTAPGHAVNKLSLRGAGLVSPSGTFAKYLEDALVSDLKEALVYDAKARTQLAAEILKNDMDISSFSVGKAAIEVRLVVTRDGQRRLDKRYPAAITFDSHLMGNIAIPAGQAAYSGVVRELLRSIYSDPQFLAAIGK